MPCSRRRSTRSWLLVVALGAPAAAQTLDRSGERVLFDFTEGTNGWRTVNDNVMGGRSRGGFSVEAGVLVFSGNTNTDGGGFSSIRTLERAWNLGSAEGLIVRVRTEGPARTFQLGVRTDAHLGRTNLNYRTPLLVPADGTWHEIAVPFAELRAQARGEWVDDAPALRRDQIQTLGFMVNDGQDGPFRLEVDWIKAYAADLSDPDVSGPDVSVPPFATPIAAREAFASAWGEPEGRPSRLAAWRLRASRSSLGAEGYLFQLARWEVADDERGRIADDVYDALLHYGGLPDGLAAVPLPTEDRARFAERFLVRPVRRAMERGDADDLPTRLAILSSAGDALPRYRLLAEAWSELPAPAAQRVRATLARHAATDEALSDPALDDFLRTLYAP